MLMHHPSLIGRLLTWAATGTEIDLAFDRRSDQDLDLEFQWAIDGGLGPLLHQATAIHFDIVPGRWRDPLLAADLTARVRHADLVASAVDTIEACIQVGETMPLLLKGISTSSEFYPGEHLRPMADVDVLISCRAYAPVEAALTVEYATIDHGKARHHGPPLRHRRRGTIVELHTTLFPSDSEFFGPTLFDARCLQSHSVHSYYRGRPVQRLAPALQLAYIASSWFNDMTTHKVQPSFLASVFDAIFLLKSCAHTLDWDAMPQWLDNQMARGSTYVMLTYLPRFGVASPPASTIAWLSKSQRMVGPIQLRAIHWMLDRHLLGARRWGWFLPMPVPGRYSPVRQIRKRFLASV